jgi:ATP-dependent Clp protease ATP-binding subunit ClpC
LEHLDSYFTPLAEARGLRFTGRARLAFRYAEQEAARRGQPTVTEAHLLLGVIRDRESVAGFALADLGLAPEALVRVAEEILAAASPGEAGSRLVAVVEAAFEEARSMGHEHVGTEHLLLALLQQPALRTLLDEAGATMETARAEVLRALEGWAHNTGPASLCAGTG